MASGYSIERVNFSVRREMTNAQFNIVVAGFLDGLPEAQLL